MIKLGESYFIDYKDSRLHYTRIGDGAMPLLLFHGFGQDRNAFADWSTLTSAKYTLYTFDLFYHGYSQWNGPQPMEMKDWENIVRQFLIINKIEKFVVAGYSLGARFALATISLFPERISKAILIAPDGIVVSNWYRLATGSFLMRKIFHRTIKYPAPVLFIAELMAKLRLVHKGVVRFVNAQMGSEEKRRRVYQSWTAFRLIRTDTARVATLLNEYAVPVIFVLGRHDRIVSAESLKPFIASVDYKNVHILNEGHNALLDKTLAIFKGPPTT